MKLLAAIVLCLMATTGWAGDNVSPPVHPMDEMPPPGYYGNMERRLQTYTPSHWEIKSIPLSEANEFLKANPEWEPFSTEPNWSRLGGPGTLYLKRRVK